MYLEEEIERINKTLYQLEGKKNIVIWGAAENTVRLFQYTDILHYDVAQIADKAKEGMSFFGRELVIPDDVKWSEVEVVVISSFFREDEIESELFKKYQYKGTIIKLNRLGQEMPFYQHQLKHKLQASQSVQHVLMKNKKFENIHAGERLFILCCGASIRSMDLTVLENEITMAVHSFYLHKDIKRIKPTYYCNAKWEQSLKDLEEPYCKELKQYVGNAQYFFSVDEKELIEKIDVFEQEELNYYQYGPSNLLYEEIDLCQKIMPIQSVPILCLQLALYMGFKEIYLLGTEHDTLVALQYDHFYNKEESIISRSCEETDETGKLNDTYSHQVQCTYNLWEQYKVLKKIAEKKGVKIYNATIGGQLDIFDRVDFKTLF